MNYKAISLILFLSGLIFSNPVKAMENPDESGAIIKTLARKLDTKVLDAGIVSGCSTYGATVGNKVAISLSYYSYGCFGARFNPLDHWEDELGTILGGVLGYHVGVYVVNLRHSVTDRLFLQIGSLSYACVSATHRFIQNQTNRFTNWVCGFLSRQEDRLNGYANPKVE